MSFLRAACGVLFIGACVVAGDPDENSRILMEKIHVYVEQKWDGQHEPALLQFDADGDGALDETELWYALAEIGVGSYVTRSAWASGILEYFGCSTLVVEELLQVSMQHQP